MKLKDPKGVACLRRILLVGARRYYNNGDKDNGGAGSIREAGGAFKQRGAARENQFFYNKEKELINNLKKSMCAQMEFHEEQIKLHQKAIAKIKKKQKDITKQK